MSSQRPLVIYHGKCADGFTAAWVANRFYTKYALFPVDQDGWAIDAVPAVYGESPPDVTGRLVFILDFSYPRSVLLEMARAAKSIVIIDHHKTAIDDLQGIGDEALELKRCAISTLLSVDRSGAWLTWQWFFGAETPPDLVSLVDDRDRWVFKDPRSRPFAAGAFARGYTVKDWDELATPLGVAKTIADGEAIDRRNTKDINELLDTMTVWRKIDDVSVPTANLSYMSASDACAELLRRHPTASFAATWFARQDGKYVFSLRSRPGSDVDVGEIAKRYGGGGHKHASGFATDKVPT